jgi:hypothetical protein
MADNGEVLLDAIDRRTRLIQHGAIVAGVILLGLARPVVDASGVPAALTMIAVSLGLLAIAAAMPQRWVVNYQGYEIAVENNPFRGERLLIGGTVAAKGRLGRVNTLEASISTPSGREEIVARTEARFTSFRCVIRVRHSAMAAASDAELLAEVRRRGLA